MKKILGILALLFLTAALGIMALGAGVYARAQMYRQENQRTVAQFKERLAQESTASLRSRENLAMWYNLQLRQGNGGELAQVYDGILNFGGGVMGYVEFPQKEVSLPVFQDREDAPGLAHLQRSAFPIGGRGNHCVMQGNAGLGDGELLFDITDLLEGDVFVVHTLTRGYTYRVDSIERMDEMPQCPGWEENRDLCTLIIRDGEQWVVIRGERE